MGIFSRIQAAAPGGRARGPGAGTGWPPAAAPWRPLPTSPLLASLGSRRSHLAQPAAGIRRGGRPGCGEEERERSRHVGKRSQRMGKRRGRGVGACLVNAARISPEGVTASEFFTF